MDVFDAATEREMQDREMQLAVRKAEGPKPTGACHWCGDPVETEARWCCRECASDWEYAESRRRACGVSSGGGV